MFQEELINGLSLAIEEIKSMATLCKFKLTEDGRTEIDMWSWILSIGH